MRVANRRCVRRLSMRSMKAARTRNTIAITAIVLTTVLFTSLLTITISIVHGIEQSNFRQAGGWNHGTLKDLTEEQYEELKDDSLIREYGLRRFVGMPHEKPFQKSHVEVSYCDDNAAKWMYCDPAQGRLPEENTMEAATDTQVLSLLGIKPEIGAEFTMTFDVDGTPATETFTLCGWWEYDAAVAAHHVLIPGSRAEEIFEKLGTQGLDQMTGKYTLNVMLESEADIASDMTEIVNRNGYQSEDAGREDYIGIGVNWGYLSAQLSDRMDAGTMMSIVVILVLIIFTGYLIIYNVFQISVSNDIRFYGLLKTVGTTGRQLKGIVFRQAVFLSLVGIPLGLVLGYGVGAALMPIVASELNGVKMEMSFSPVIFVGSALFSLITVVISCYKPSKMAAKVSPVEAVRYTDGAGQKISHRKLRREAKKEERRVKRAVQGHKGRKGASIFRMAWANMGRSRSRTVVTILSMSLAVILLNLTCTFTMGFDMDKYIGSRLQTDFVVGNADYVNVNRLFYKDLAVEEGVIAQIEEQGGILAGGRTYGMCGFMYEAVTEEAYRQQKEKWHTLPEAVDQQLKVMEKTDGKVWNSLRLYGMERFCLDQLQVVEGDISKLYSDGNYTAAIYNTDDYGNIEWDSNWAEVGDVLNVRYAEEVEFYNPMTGEVYENEDVPGNQPVRDRAKVYHEAEYEVAAVVTIPSTMNYRAYGTEEFILNSETFKHDTDTDAVMHYTFNMADKESEAEMESFLADYTENVMPEYDYLSKGTYTAEFESMRGMFLIMGGALSFIVGLVGVLNFLNAVLTGIMTRRQEFAVLQSVGMTGSQLKRMLVTEGLLYALGAVAVSLILNLAMAPALSSVLTSMFWFFSYHFTVMPILAVVPFFAGLGIVLPLLTYRMATKKSVVERLRDIQE